MTKWTINQEKAIYEKGQNIIVSAGAGSGKTAVLTQRTIQKLLNGSDVSRLLILTFTNAAAAEMKQRIRKAIKKAGLKEQLDALNGAYITTFDSFALSIVKKYHLYLNIPKNISIMDGSIEEVKTKEIVDDIFENSYDDENFCKLINDFCAKDDTNMKEIFVSLSNKMDLLVSKDEFLSSYLDKHYNEEYLNNLVSKYMNLILDIKKAVIDNYENLSSLVDNKYLDTFNLYDLLKAKTYEEFKLSLLKVGSPRKNASCEDDYKIYKDNISTLLKELDNLTRFKDIQEIKDTLLLTKDYVSSLIKIKKEFDKRFMEYKRKVNLYSFNDIAHMAIEVVQKSSSIRKEISSSFDEIMIDEYQDTSDIQETFINLISKNNVYMVGDIKQSIYRFRNANPYIFQKKYDDYSSLKGGIKIDLLENFRSRKEVLDNINLIFNLIMDNEIGDADYKVSHQMHFGNTNYDDIWQTSANHNMDILTYNAKDIEDYSSDEIEAFTVAYDILDKIRNGYEIVDKESGTLRKASFKDFSIIMDRGTSFDLYKKIFEYMHIPLSQIKNEKLSSSDDLVIFSNLINLIVKINNHIFDDEFKYLFVSIQRSYLIGESDENIFKEVTNHSYQDTMLYQKCSLINICDLSSYELICKIIDDFDLYHKLLNLTDIKSALIKIDYLKSLAVNLSSCGYSINEFSSYLKQMSLSEKIEYSLNQDETDTVKILNIHKSKGLEYSVCYFTGLSKTTNKDDLKSKFLVDCDFNIITPYISDGIKETIYKDLLINEENKKIISEKIRLFYVALTRAKEKMILLLPLDEESEGYTSLVPTSERLKYNKISSMLISILPILRPYLKPIDFNKVILTSAYKQKLDINNLDFLESDNQKINIHKLDINYHPLKEEKYSKNTLKLISKNEYQNMQNGTLLHELFEYSDFKSSDNKYIQNFLKHISADYIKEYKEYEFYYEKEGNIFHGIIDLILEYEDKMVIIDYKTKNIVDENYLKQLKGYQEYIEKVSNKKTEIYLYSILNDTLENLS